MTEQERQERMEKMIKKMLDKSEVILQAGKPHEITKRSDKMWSPVCDVFKEEQTNEEWFCNLPTEEKARVLADEKLHFRMLGYDGFVGWLKEKHHAN